MTEADILATTYMDNCHIYRPFKDTLSATGETVFKSGLEGMLINENPIPCALSNQSGGKLQKTSSVSKLSTEYMLFCRPEVDVQAGDYLKIIHERNIVIAEAGLPQRQLSHLNIPLIDVREMV